MSLRQARELSKIITSKRAQYEAELKALETEHKRLLKADSKHRSRILKNRITKYQEALLQHERNKAAFPNERLGEPRYPDDDGVWRSAEEILRDAQAELLEIESNQAIEDMLLGNFETNS